jgi:pyruvate dehydrogenase E2 component (dihydrolipoyllysine-residue acetyltransferase)
VAQQEVLIPDIGDAEDVEVIEILAATGATIALDDPLIVIESDKASMEVPATVAGKLLKISVSVGDKVHEGQVIAVVEAAESTSGASKKAPPASEKAPPAPREVERPEAEPAAAIAEQPKSAAVERTGAAEAPMPKPPPSKVEAPRRLQVRIPDIGDAKDVVVVEVAVKPGESVAADDLLVVLESDKASMEIPAPVAGTIASVDVEEGATVEEGSLLVVIETREDVAPPTTAVDASKASEAQPGEATNAPPVEGEDGASVEAEGTPAEAAPSNKGNVYAGPAVRRLARELGVDLTKVNGTGARNRVLKTDVDEFVKSALAGQRSSTGGGIPTVPAIDFSRFGEVETIELTRIRARGAENLRRSWLNIPHVTQHDEADVTDLETFRAELKAEAQAKDVKLTPLAFIVKAVISTLKAFPTFNASLDQSIRRLIVKRYFHIGLAVDTADGLVVPVLHDADRRGIFDLAKEIEELSQKAQRGKLTMSDLQGASFTISSLGAIGGTAFTPIINAPEVAILGVSRVAVKPRWNGTAFEPRKMLPVSLSYDHRAINGAEAGRFVTTLCQTLTDMRRVLL